MPIQDSEARCSEMPINPVLFSHQVNEQFRRWQLTAFPLTDSELYEQVRSMLTESPTGASPLVKGPYVSLSRSFQQGAAVADLVSEGLAHPKLTHIAEYPRLFAHQEEAFRAVKANRHCLISTGTGSGKTESFLYPIIDHCLCLQDQGAPPGVVAVLVYPMNALAQDQLERLRLLLAGTGITFGLYVGSTPASGDEPSGYKRLPKGAGPNDLRRARRKHHGSGMTVVPYEERLSEETMAAEPPRLLLTNAKQLELLLTRSKDLGMFDGAPLRFIVFDEVHTYSGSEGAEAALLVRRLRAFARKRNDEVICIGTSATLTDPETGDQAGAHFAHRFFGVDPETVTLVSERYEEESWPDEQIMPSPPDSGALTLLDRSLRALADDDAKPLADVFQRLTGKPLTLKASWQTVLYDTLKKNAFVKAVYESLAEPCHLVDAVRRVHTRLGWDPSPTEEAQAHLLTYLVLGAAAEKDGNPLLRPKVHYFVRGLEGVTATLVQGSRPKLHFSGQEAQEAEPDLAPAAIFPVSVCRTCGQHFFTAYLQGFTVTDDRKRVAAGGQLEGGTAIWLPSPSQDEGGSRVLFTDRFVAEDAEELEEFAADKVRRRLASKHLDLYVCRRCGTFHLDQTATCMRPECGLNEPPIHVRVVGQVGEITLCPACGHRGPEVGGRTLEPIRPLRAVTTADVHILAQEMLAAVEPEQRKLIVFADNRQDAAFQAGWMKDHARRYRFRHLMWETLRHSSGFLEVADLADIIYRRLKADRDLARTLAPELFRNPMHSEHSKRFDENLRLFVRFTVIRELAIGYMQRDGLESWGLMRVSYRGITAASPRIKHWASGLGLSPEGLVDGISSLLDAWRRDRVIYDPATEVFSKYWRSNDREVEEGLLPLMDVPPRGVKPQRDTNDSPNFVKQLIGQKGSSFAQGFVRKWGLSTDGANRFLEELWTYLTDELHLLHAVTLKSNKGKPLSKASGVYQIHLDMIELSAQQQRYRCNVCQRLHGRPTPRMVCVGHNCPGRLIPEEAPRDNYNVSQLLSLGEGDQVALLRPEEHTAQVPAERRADIEQRFKAANGSVNCLVASPTLEMGVDIGALDMVLLRNVPPTSSNYWQRAGRAGRRQRMAVIYTYCRRSQHDSYFFADPMRLLSGRIAPPRFNLRNPILIRKHVHATVLSELRRMERSPKHFALDAKQHGELKSALEEAVPTFVSEYLYQPGTTGEGTRLHRTQPVRVLGLERVTATYRDRLVETVRDVFSTGWPEEAADEVNDDRLTEYVDGMAPELQRVIDRVWNRFMSTRQVLERLNRKRELGTLTAEEEKLRWRCEGYLKSLSSASQDNYTLSVLAVEGFLPGYGIQEGQIEANFRRSAGISVVVPEFALRRPPLLAAREFVPGNLLYANGSRFKVNRYHVPVKERLEPEVIRVDVKGRRIHGTGNTGYAECAPRELPVIEIADCDLEHVSHISDEEGFRFQVPVMMLGQMLPHHRGGAIYQVNGRTVQHMRGQAVRVVNVGPMDQVSQQDPNLGYPVCTVCGHVRSPYASKAELDNFRELHKSTCGRTVDNVGFTAEAQVDGLWVPDLESASQAASLAEAIRLGAEQILEMDHDDLQVMLLPNSQDRQDLFLCDPMPGGSGVLAQIIRRWPEVLAAARELLTHCPSGCEKACYDCLKDYHNVMYHQYLDRHLALHVLDAYDGMPEAVAEVPPAQPMKQAASAGATNPAEYRLAKLLEWHQFPAPEAQVRVDLPESVGIPYTITDYFYNLPSGHKVAVFLDGLSKGVHGNPDQQRKDELIRDALEDMGIEVIVIPASHLSDAKGRLLFMKKLARALGRRELTTVLEQDLSWDVEAT